MMGPWVRVPAGSQKNRKPSDSIEFEGFFVFDKQDQVEKLGDLGASEDSYSISKFDRLFKNVSVMKEYRLFNRLPLFCLLF
jgi:hypothetical protein